MTATSRAAFAANLASGLIGARRLEVYRSLGENGPNTARANCALAGVELASHRTRHAELRKMGLARVVGTAIDAVTGEECELWAITDRIYQKPDEDTRLRNQLEDIENQIRDTEVSLAEKRAEAERVRAKIEARRLNKVRELTEQFTS